MAQLINKILGGGKSVETQVPLTDGDSDFADYVADAAEPAPAAPFDPVPGGASLDGAAAEATARPYTKWYRLQDRFTLADFQSEGIILLFISAFLILHLIGARRNRSKARAWMRAHAPALKSEFALVGFNRAPVAVADEGEMMKEKSLFEFATYATGRQNVAFVDARLTLLKRFNPLQTAMEMFMGLLVDAAGVPTEALEATLYPFDGKEAQLVKGLPGAGEAAQAKGAKSMHDGFVWAIVNKDCMQTLRDERYDLSITYTKDHPKLPNYLTIMGESAEITDTLLTPDLIEAVKAAGDKLHFLLISDQPVVKPKTIAETVPKKRVSIKYLLPKNDDYSPLMPIFNYFLRSADILVQSAHFRPEVMRKVRNVRDETIRQIQKVEDELRNEERAAEREKAKKAKRDTELGALDAKAQKKYLEREKEKEMRKSMKKQTSRA